MNLRKKSNYHSNKEKLCINNENGDSTDNMLDVSLQNDDKIKLSECSNSSSDPIENVLLNQNSTLNHCAAPTDITGTTDSQLIHSPSRSVRRCHSNASDDDHFQIVTYKKSKQLNNQDGGNIRPHQIHLHQDTVITNDNVNVSNSSSNFVNVIPSHLQQQHSITSASTRYALTRFPFPPHIVRFNSNKISIIRFKEVIVHHFKSHHDLNVDIANCRISTLKCNTNEIDILLYVKDPNTFAFLLNHDNWPETVYGEKFTFPSVPSIPPQLSLIIKNVDLNLDFDDFSNEIKNLYPEVKNVIRMKNKFGNFIKLVKLELTSPKTRDDLLKSKKIFINYICYDIEEYLAPVNVLICSKCCAIGHFRRQCPEQDETCKCCGESCKDLKGHQCSSVLKCKHCNGVHLSNSMKCPVVKSFRDALTKNLMNKKNDNVSYSSPSLTNSNTNNNNKFHHTTANFSRSSAPWTLTENPFDSKINVLISGLAQVNETLIKLCESNKSFQQFIIEKNERDVEIIKEIGIIKSSSSNMEAEILLLKEKYQDFDKSMKAQDVMYKQLLFPMLDNILKFIGAMNVDAGGRPLDADIRSKFERFRAQVSNAIDGKVFV
jgi:hypothetical protein